MDVVLEKSPSGTWQTPSGKKRSREPWRRLWLSAALLHLLMVSAGCWLMMPTREDVERRMVFAVTEEVRRHDGLAYAGESPRAIYERARSTGYDAWISQQRSKFRIGPEGDAAFAKISGNYREELDALPVRRLFIVLAGSVAWGAPMAVLYAVGAVIAWVRRGGRG